MPEDFAYKAFFDLARYPGETSDLNPYLVSAARFLNMHARNGVPAANMDLAVVVAGVRIYVCGQSMTFGGIDKSELAEPAQVALSAMTMLTVLQSEGYALLP